MSIALCESVCVPKIGKRHGVCAEIACPGTSIKTFPLNRIINGPLHQH